MLLININYRNEPGESRSGRTAAAIFTRCSSLAISAFIEAKVDRESGENSRVEPELCLVNFPSPGSGARSFQGPIVVIIYGYRKVRRGAVEKSSDRARDRQGTPVYRCFSRRQEGVLTQRCEKLGTSTRRTIVIVFREVRHKIHRYGRKAKTKESLEQRSHFFAFINRSVSRFYRDLFALFL